MAEFDNIDKAREWLQSYMRLATMGNVGRFISPEYKLFKNRYTEEQIDAGYRDGLNLLDWCIVKALNALTVSDEELIFNKVQAAAKKAAETGEHADLQQYLKLKRLSKK